MEYLLNNWIEGLGEGVGVGGSFMFCLSAVNYLILYTIQFT